MFPDEPLSELYKAKERLGKAKKPKVRHLRRVVAADKAMGKSRRGMECSSKKEAYARTKISTTTMGR